MAIRVLCMLGRSVEGTKNGREKEFTQGSLTKSHQHFQPTHKLLPALGAAWQTAGGLCAELHTALGVPQLW